MPSRHRGDQPGIIREQQNSIRDLVGVLFRYKWHCIIFFSISFLLVIVATYSLPEIYESEAKIYLRIGRESLPSDPILEADRVSISENRDHEINTETTLLGSLEIIEAVVDRITPARLLDRPDEAPSGEATRETVRQVRREVRRIDSLFHRLLVALDLTSRLSLRDEAIVTFQENLFIEPQQKSNIVNVRFRSESNDTARDALHLLLNYYLDYRQKVHQSQATSNFFEGQVKRIREELRKKELEIDSFRTAHGITSMADQKSALLSHISQLEFEIGNLSGTIHSSEVRIATLKDLMRDDKQFLVSSKVTGMENRVTDFLKQNLLELRMKEKDLATRYKGNFRALIDIREQIKLGEAELKKEKETRTETTTSLNPNYQYLAQQLDLEKAQMDANQALMEKLNGNLADWKTKLNELVKHEVKLSILKRDLASLENEYSYHLENMRRAINLAALDAGNISNASIVQHATLPKESIKPKKMLLLALGFIFASFGGIMLTFVLNYFDETLKSVEDVERRVKLPVLVSIMDTDYKTISPG